MSTLFNKNDVFEMILKDIDTQLKSVLENYHYLSEEAPMCKDAHVALEAIINKISKIGV